MKRTYIATEPGRYVDLRGPTVVYPDWTVRLDREGNLCVGYKMVVDEKAGTYCSFIKRKAPTEPQWEPYSIERPYKQAELDAEVEAGHLIEVIE